MQKYAYPLEFDNSEEIADFCEKENTFEEYN